jgi:hypothetical protein
MSMLVHEGPNPNLSERPTLEAQVQASLEVNSKLFANLPEDGSAVDLEIFPDSNLVGNAPEDEVRGYARHQIRNLLGVDNPDLYIDDIISVESYDPGSEDGKKTIGRTEVYETPDRDGVEKKYIALHSGSRAPEGSSLALTASLENPKDLDERAREERNREMARSNLIRKLIGKLQR